MSILDIFKSDTTRHIAAETGREILPNKYDTLLDIISPQKQLAPETKTVYKKVDPGPWYKNVPAPVWIGGGIGAALLIGIALKKKK